MVMYNATILLFVVALGVFSTRADPSAPYYADPWTFYATVSFPTSQSAYIAQGFLMGSTYREDEHGTGYFHTNYFVHDEQRLYNVFHTVMQKYSVLDAEPEACRTFPYRNATFLPDMFANSTYIREEKFNGAHCSLFSGHFNEIPYTVCHVPFEEDRDDIGNGYPIFYNTSYSTPGIDGLTPLLYTFFSYRSGTLARGVIPPGTMDPPDVCA